MVRIEENFILRVPYDVGSGRVNEEHCHQYNSTSQIRRACPAPLLEVHYRRLEGCSQVCIVAYNMSKCKQGDSVSAHAMEFYVLLDRYVSREAIRQKFVHKIALVLEVLKRMAQIVELSQKSLQDW